MYRFGPVVPLLVSSVVCGQVLPVKRVVLYKNGVGYFEHVGRVRDKQDVTISFTSGQLNDVLKSLTVLDLDGGKITGVGYGSSAPIEKQMGDLRLSIDHKSSLTDILGALRGGRLEVHSGTATLTGRLLSVGRKTRMGGGATLEVDYVSLLGDNGEIRTTEVSPNLAVRLLDSGLSTQVGRFLDLLSVSRQADVRRMVISTDGTGERSMARRCVAAPCNRSIFGVSCRVRSHLTIVRSYTGSYKRRPRFHDVTSFPSAPPSSWASIHFPLIDQGLQSNSVLCTSVSERQQTRRLCRSLYGLRNWHRGLRASKPAYHEIQFNFVSALGFRLPCWTT